MTLSKPEAQRLRDRYGDWAVVTGASSGIGAELARQLAQAGFHLVIHGRDAGKLAQLQGELKGPPGLRVEAVVADLTQAAGREALLTATAGLPVGLFILSAGLGSSGYFLESELDTEVAMLRLNAEAVLVLLHHMGRRMAAQGRGGVVLLSSLVAFQGVPFAAHYAATKAYVQSLGEALAQEWKPLGLDVLVAAPGPVASAFGERAGMQMGFSLTPAQVGVPILRALGRRRTVLPGWLSKFLVYSLRTSPRPWRVRIMQQIMGGMTQHQRVPRVDS